MIAVQLPFNHVSHIHQNEMDHRDLFITPDLLSLFDSELEHYPVRPARQGKDELYGHNYFWRVLCGESTRFLWKQRWGMIETASMEPYLKFPAIVYLLQWNYLVLTICVRCLWLPLDQLHWGRIMCSVPPLEIHRTIITWSSSHTSEDTFQYLV